MRLDSTVVVDGLAFGESPRWHDDRLWFADFYDRVVFSLGEADHLVREGEVPQQPGGLGWLADGRMLVVSRLDRRVLRRETDGTLVEHADLSHLVRGDCNDMVVDCHGHAFVGEYGFDLYEWFGGGGGFDDAPAGTLICVQPDGTSDTACTGLRLPNGAVVTDDGVLIVAETFAARLTAFDVDEATGELTGRRVWAELPGRGPDGIALDSTGGIWVADSRRAECVRVESGGLVTHVVTTTQKCYACVVGGEEGETLFCLTAPTTDEATMLERRSGRLEACRIVRD